MSIRCGEGTAALIFATVVALVLPRPAAARPTAKPGDADDCTTIAVGRLATVDGSVITSESCDGHDGRVWVDKVPHRSWPQGATTEIRTKTDFQYAPGDLRPTEVLGAIPQVPETYAYLNTIYPAINEHQLAIGESTFGGKEIMRSEEGIFDCYELTRILSERCRTAREAIRTAGELLANYGWIDKGETLTIADTSEVWLMEIVGPGEGRKGAVWVARRVPDEHVTVAANASRVRQVDCDDSDTFMCSDNIISRAVELGLYDPDSGQPFEFCYAYSHRSSFSSRRREWRVFDLLAPSLELHANGENFPFSVKPEKKLAVADIMALFRDTFEDTPYDLRRFVTTTDEDGKTVISPYASPFMLYDQMPLHKVYGGWLELGERPIARWYCINVWITQSRSWLPDDIGGIAWLGWDNPAMTVWVPMYAGMTDVPESFKKGGELYDGGRPPFTSESAWWTFNRVSTLASQRWGDMRNDVDEVRAPLQEEAFALQQELDARAQEMAAAGDPQLRSHLTESVIAFADKLTAAYWQLGDDLWTRYDEKW
jgi:dipeptidase